MRMRGTVAAFQLPQLRSSPMHDLHGADAYDSRGKYLWDRSFLHKLKLNNMKLRVMSTTDLGVRHVFALGRRRIHTSCLHRSSKMRPLSSP